MDYADAEKLIRIVPATVWRIEYLHPDGRWVPDETCQTKEIARIRAKAKVNDLSLRPWMTRAQEAALDEENSYPEES